MLPCWYEPVVRLQRRKSVGFIGGGRVARIILARLYCKLAE